MDMLCISPYHDRYFCEALKQVGIDVTLASISFHLDRDFFHRNHLTNDPGLLDVAAKLRIRRAGVRQILKAIELCLNLLAYSMRFVFTRPDIIHIQWLPLVTHTRVELWFLRFARRLGIKLVYSVHNVLPHDTGDRFEKEFRTVYGMMDALICHTETSRAKLLSGFGQDANRIWTIPPGPWLHPGSGESYRAGARRALGFNNGECLVLFAGSIAPYKGIDFLLEAWDSAVKQIKTPAKLVIVGPTETELANELRERVERLSLQDSVSLNLAFVPTKLLVTYHNAADLLVYPYKDITHSAAVLTGITFGKPIVATAIPAFQEFFGHESAWLVPYGDCKALASALVHLIDEPEKRERWANGAQAQLQRMPSWLDAARKATEAYRKVLALPEPAYVSYSRVWRTEK